MLQSIFKPKLIDILPPSVLADEKFRATAEALDNELEKTSELSFETLHLPRLEKLSDDVLDHLAWQFHVDNYSASFSKERKRAMIRESIFLHRIKGTPAAVELAIKPFTINGQVQEWFQYGGKPFFFKILTKYIADLGDDGQRFLQIVYDAKNVRSWLEDITIDLTREFEDHHNHYTAIAEANGGRINFDIDKKLRDDKHKIYSAIAEANAGFIRFGIDSDLKPMRQDFGAAVAEAYGGIFYFGCDFQGYTAEDLNLELDQLRLTFSFAGNQTRILTMPNPRLDVTADEIKDLSEFTANREVLLNYNGDISDGISRAVIISKRKETIL